MNKELMLMLNSPEESTEKLTPSKLKLPTLVELSSNSNSLVLLITPTLYLLLNPWLMTKPSLMTDPLPVLLKTTNMPPITPECKIIIIIYLFL